MIYDKFTLLICGDTFRMHFIPFLNVLKAKQLDIVNVLKS